MSRNIKIIVVVLAVAGVALAILTSLAHGTQTSPMDAGLQKTGGRMKAILQSSPAGRYNGQPSFMNAFQLYQHDQQQLLVSNMQKVSKSDQFEQVQIWETTTMPPVSLVLRSTKQPGVLVDQTLVGQVAAGKPVTTTVQQGNVQFRAYLTPLRPPSMLAENNTKEVLEVFQVEQE